MGINKKKFLFKHRPLEFLLRLTKDYKKLVTTGLRIFMHVWEI